MRQGDDEHGVHWQPENFIFEMSFLNRDKDYRDFLTTGNGFQILPMQLLKADRQLQKSDT